MPTEMSLLQILVLQIILLLQRTAFSSLPAEVHATQLPNSSSTMDTLEKLQTFGLAASFWYFYTKKTHPKYAMLCGYLPFDDDPSNPDGENITRLYKYILETKLEFPEQVSPSAKQLLKRILIPDPAKRASLQEIIQHP